VLALPRAIKLPPPLPLPPLLFSLCLTQSCWCADFCRAFGIFIVCIGIITSSVLFSTIYLLGGFPANTVPIKAA
jgi:hypothetical protein